MKKLLILIFICSYHISLKPNPFMFKAATFKLLGIQASKMRTRERQKQQQNAITWEKRFKKHIQTIVKLEKQLQKKVNDIQLKKPKIIIKKFLFIKEVESHQLYLQKTPNALIQLIEIERELSKLNELPINELSLKFDPLIL